MFRERLISQISEKYGSGAERSRRGGRPSLCDNLFRLVEKHFPSNEPTTVACEKKGTRRKTRYQCDLCDVGLCAAPCFKKYKLKKF